MLYIKSDILHDLKTQILADEKEQGFVLGCTSSFDCIDRVAMIPEKESGPYFYMPDSNYANGIIRNWAKNNICFSGFIHSHTKGNRSFSQNDLEFAEQLLSQYQIPFLWFGLAVVDENSVEILIYKLCQRGSDTAFEQMPYEELE